MAQNEAYDYIYTVHWDGPVPYTVQHAIKLNSGINRADFENFMIEEGFPMVGNISTRIGGVKAQQLFIDATGSPPLRVEDLDLSFDSFGKRISVKKFIASGIWSR